MWWHLRQLYSQQRQWKWKWRQCLRDFGLWRQHKLDLTQQTEQNSHLRTFNVSNFHSKGPHFQAGHTPPLWEHHQLLEIDVQLTLTPTQRNSKPLWRPACSEMWGQHANRSSTCAHTLSILTGHAALHAATSLPMQSWHGSILYVHVWKCTLP